MYHVHRAGTDANELESLPHEWFNFCQLCDAPAVIPRTIDAIREEVRERRLYLGEGGIDIAGILRHTPEMVYAIEVPNKARLDQYGSMEHAARALEIAKAYFARHPRPVAA